MNILIRPSGGAGRFQLSCVGKAVVQRKQSFPSWPCNYNLFFGGGLDGRWAYSLLFSINWKSCFFAWWNQFGWRLHRKSAAAIELQLPKSGKWRSAGYPFVAQFAVNVRYNK